MIGPERQSGTLPKPEEDPSDRRKFNPGFYGDGDEGGFLLEELRTSWSRADAPTDRMIEQFGLLKRFYDAGVEDKPMPDVPVGYYKEFFEKFYAAGKTDFQEEKNKTPLTKEQIQLLKRIGFVGYGIRKITPDKAEELIAEANKKMPPGFKVGDRVFVAGIYNKKGTLGGSHDSLLSISFDDDSGGQVKVSEVGKEVTKIND